VCIHYRIVKASLFCAVFSVAKILIKKLIT